MRTQTYPMLRGSGCSLGKSPHFSGPSSPVSKQFFSPSPPPFFWRSDTRATFLKKKEKKKKQQQTNHFRLQPRSVSPPAALLRCPLLSSHLYSSLPLSALSTPADAADTIFFSYMRVMTRGSAQLCSPGDGVWNPDGGRTAAEISCDSDHRLLLRLLLPDLCRAAPLPPLLPEHTGIPFNSLFLPVVKPPCRRLTATVRTALHYPSVGGHYFPLKMPGCQMCCVEMARGSF